MVSKIKRHEVNALIERRERLLALQAKWTPHAKQQEVIDAIKQGYKKIFVLAARQSGKTEIAKYCAVSVAGLTPNKVVSIITPSLKQANKIYWKKRSLQDLPPRSWIAKEDNSEYTLYFHNGSYIELDGSENIDAHRGDKKDLIILDEYKDIDPRFLPEVIEPMFATTDGVVITIGTPPETPESHFRELHGHALLDPSWKVIHWTGYDSPYVSNEWLDAKRAELDLRGELDVFKREYLAEYTVGGKNSVFPMFEKATHVRSIPLIARFLEAKGEKIEYYWVNDPATSSTFGSLLIAYYRTTGQIFFLDEIYAKDKSEMHTEAIYEQFLAKSACWNPVVEDWFIVHDDAAAWFANELFHKFGLMSHPADKASVKQEEGIGLFKSLLLQKNTVVISELCSNLVIEIQNYIMLNGKFPTINDHLIDDVRYFLNFARVILSLAENDDLSEDEEDYLLALSFEGNGLPTWLN